MRPFKITQVEHDKLMAKFSAYLKNVCMTTNSFSFSHSMEDVKNKEKVFVTFSMKAYIKMRDLVDRFESEVGWFGFIDKISDLEYNITDICVYPQLVTGATVKETNEAWDDDMPIEQIKRRHFHGHSHVNMAPNPSSTDIRHRDDQVAMVKSDSFYFFFITNKKCAWTAALFDLANNVVYDTDDILIDVDLGDGEMLSDFVDETRKMVKVQTASALKQMMDERNGVKSAVHSSPIVSTTSNQLKASAVLPATKQPQTKKKDKKHEDAVKTYTGESIPSQLGFSDLMPSHNTGSTYDDFDYYDDFLGYVSDTPSSVNHVILAAMR